MLAPMKAFVVLAHPEPKSFNAAMFQTAVETLRDAGYEVLASDLYRAPFDPVSDRRNFTSTKDPDYFKQQIEEMHATEVGGFAPDIEAELKKMEACDLMIWQFPLWWFGLPAILKGWVDRVLAMGRTYGGGRIYETGVFRGKRALLALTTGGPAEAYVKDGFNGDISGILRPIHRGMLEFTGFDVLAPQIVYGPVRRTEEQLQKELEGYAKRLRAIEEEAPIDVGRY
jgi:NAD(P)H dehydrogenase (quinone)